MSSKYTQGTTKLFLPRSRMQNEPLYLLLIIQGLWDGFANPKVNPMIFAKKIACLIFLIDQGRS